MMPYDIIFLFRFVKKSNDQFCALQRPMTSMASSHMFLFLWERNNKKKLVEISKLHIIIVKGYIRIDNILVYKYAHFWLKKDQHLATARKMKVFAICKYMCTNRVYT